MVRLETVEEMTTPPTLLFRSRGPLVILVHGKGAPSSEDWNAYIQHLDKALQNPGSSILVVAGSAPAPTAVQRDQLARVTPKRVRTAVVTESQLNRGVVTLLGWFHENIAAFAPEKIYAALDYLGVPHEERTLVQQSIGSMRGELAGEATATRGASGTPRESAIAPMNDAVARLSEKLGTRRRD